MQLKLETPLVTPSNLEPKLSHSASLAFGRMKCPSYHTVLEGWQEAKQLLQTQVLLSGPNEKCCWQLFDMTPPLKRCRGEARNARRNLIQQERTSQFFGCKCMCSFAALILLYRIPSKTCVQPPAPLFHKYVVHFVRCALCAVCSVNQLSRRTNFRRDGPS